MIKDTANALQKSDPIIPLNELVVEEDTGIFKYGDGVKRYNALSVAGRDATGLYASSDVVYPNISTVTGDKTLSLDDAGKIQKVTAAATITVPTNATVAFPTSTQIVISSFASADVAVSAASGVTIRSKDGKLKIDGQYAAATLIKVASDEWVLVGALKA